MPTLQPWMLTTRAPAQRFVAVRNPYFHRVDAKGQQLPYIDKLILEVVDGKLIPIKTGAGEIDLQARRLVFKDYTFLRESEPRNGLTTLSGRKPARRIWRSTRTSTPPTRSGAACSVTCASARRWRWASIATASASISMLAWPCPRQHRAAGQPAVGRRIGTDCMSYEPETAEALLDELGLDQRDADGIRLLPDGRRMEMWSRARARTASSRTCWRSSPTSGPRSASRSCPSPPTARSCAPASIRATP